MIIIMLWYFWDGFSYENYFWTAQHLLRDDGLSSVDIKSETETLRPDSPDDLSEYLTSSRREDLQEVPLEVLPLWDLILELGRIEGKK